MTTTTATRRTAPATPAAPPAASSAPAAAAPGGDETLADLALRLGVEHAVDVVLGPCAPARDVYHMLDGVSGVAAIATGGPSAAALEVGQTASMKWTAGGGAKVGPFVEGEANASVEKTKTGYTVSTSLTAKLGVKGDLNDRGEGKLSGLLGATVTHDVTSGAQADGLVNHFAKTTAKAVALAHTAPVLGVLGAGAAVTAFDDETLATAATVQGRFAVGAGAELSIFKAEEAGEPAAELGIAVESERAFTLTVKNDNGKKTAIVEHRAKVTVEAKGSLEGGDVLAASVVKKVEGGEATIVDRITFPLPDDFDMTDALNPAAVAAAVRGDGERETSVEAQVGAGRYVGAVKLDIAGGRTDALVVVAAALGVDAAQAKARAIPLQGEMTYSRVEGASAKVAIAKVAELGVEATTTTKAATRTIKNFASVLEDYAVVAPKRAEELRAQFLSR